MPSPQAVCVCSVPASHARRGGSRALSPNLSESALRLDAIVTSHLHRGLHVVLMHRRFRSESGWLRGYAGGRSVWLPTVQPVTLPSNSGILL